AGSGVAQGAGAVSGLVDLSLAVVDSGGRLLAAAGGQAGESIGVVDLRLGNSWGWIDGGFTRSGAVPGPAGLDATGQQRWHLAGRFQHEFGGVQLWGRGLFSRRTENGTRADWHDIALGLSGGTRWQWRLVAATGGQQESAASSQLAQARAVVSGATGLVLPGAAEPISLA
ncbi:hypothetical protein, partial [Sandarakinorhabdus oryzae]|uniref:hypothetical protein n=1 Tax=Sandarakinorhabdus oryzae TaxID=2675220 RepID=UPI0018CC1170